MPGTRLTTFNSPSSPSSHSTTGRPGAESRGRVTLCPCTPLHAPPVFSAWEQGQLPWRGWNKEGVGTPGGEDALCGQACGLGGEGRGLERWAFVLQALKACGGGMCSDSAKRQVEVGGADCRSWGLLCSLWQKLSVVPVPAKEEKSHCSSFLPPCPRCGGRARGTGPGAVVDGPLASRGLAQSCSEPTHLLPVGHLTQL